MQQLPLINIPKALSAHEAGKPRRKPKPRKSLAVLVFLPPRIADAVARHRLLVEKRAKGAGR